MMITHAYEDVINPDRFRNEIGMSPNVVYGAGDQKPSEIKMKKNQVYGLGQNNYYKNNGCHFPERCSQLATNCKYVYIHFYGQ